GDAGAPTTSGPAAAVTDGPTTTKPVVVTTTTERPRRKTHLDQPLGFGMAGDDVVQVQRRLRQLGFAPGPIDGQFGGLTQASVWAFEKLVLDTPRAEATGIVTDRMWQRMQDDIRFEPRRPDADTADHTEVYLPQQVAIFFRDDEPVLITHISSGTGERWCDEVTISPGEIGNVEGTEPLKRGECGVSDTPGGVYHYDRAVEGIRESALGSLWNPVYFNYGIAIHGAQTVPLYPASHGCIRMPLTISETFQKFVSIGDAVYVFDGEHDPEDTGSPPPTFNSLDPDYTTTTTSTTSTTTTTTVPETTTPRTTEPEPEPTSPPRTTTTTSPPTTKPPRSDPTPPTSRP
ncbi:MAG: murein L,D-transpeptidase, partial [Acidimicrobiia bacterium]|nr:murein L,D-transpeptidase [Acidimicrobiia bacterium]